MSFKEFFSRQARKPSGLFGRFCAPIIFDKGNRALNQRMVGLVEASGSDRILEIGFGTGTVVCKMADALTDGVVEGIDFSDSMINLARKRNRHHVVAGRVQLIRGDFDEMSYEPDSFNSVCSANTIYFWPDPKATSDRILDILKPGGSLVLAFVGKESMKAKPLSKDVFSMYSPEDVHALLENAGFSSIEIHHANGPDSGMHCVKATK
jgi:ubiquinone/menaquinone biosynthesis C-methylase UbiE